MGAKPHDRVGFADVVLYRPHGWLVRGIGEKLFVANSPAGLGVPLLVLIGRRHAGWLVASSRRSSGCCRSSGCWWRALFVLGAPLGVRLFPWRSWLLLAPMAVLVAADGVWRLGRSSPRVAGGGGRARRSSSARRGRVRCPARVAHRPAGPYRVAGRARCLLLVSGCGWPAARPDRVSPSGSCWHTCWSPVRCGPATLLEPIPPRVFYSRGGAPRVTLPWRRPCPPTPGCGRFPVACDSTSLPASVCAAHRTGQPSSTSCGRCTRGEPPSVEELVEQLKRHQYDWLVVDPSFGELLRARNEPTMAARYRQELESCPELEPVVRARSSDAVAVWRVRGAD